MAWCRDQGLDPHRLTSVVIDDASLTATVTEYKLRGGKRYYEHGVMAQSARQVRVASLPPRRGSVRA